MAPPRVHSIDLCAHSVDTLARGGQAHYINASLLPTPKYGTTLRVVLSVREREEEEEEEEEAELWRVSM